MNRWTVGAIAVALASALYLLVSTPALDLLRANVGAAAILAAGYGLLLATSGWVVRTALWFAGVDRDEAQEDTGRAVGKVENVLILTLSLLGAYTALAVVFTAKSIVRWQDISSGDTTYYLTGSITNVTYSLLYGVLLVELLQGRVI